MFRHRPRDVHYHQHEHFHTHLHAQNPHDFRPFFVPMGRPPLGFGPRMHHHAQNPAHFPPDLRHLRGMAQQDKAKVEQWFAYVAELVRNCQRLWEEAEEAQQYGDYGRMRNRLHSLRNQVRMFEDTWMRRGGVGGGGIRPPLRPLGWNGRW